MKRFLPLFILTGLLFGQDVLHLKTGESLFWSYRTADLANMDNAYSDLGPNWILDTLNIEHGNMFRELLRNQISG